MTLTALANHFGTDKGTAVGNSHGYTNVYEKLFCRFRNEPINFLELGLQIGTGYSSTRQVTAVPSVEMWKNYFPKAHIYGFDISDFSRFEDERFSFFQGDCGSTDDLRKLTKFKFDVIIDDASHAAYHQQMALKELLPSLKSGGLYLIEDIEWTPDCEKWLPPAPRTVDVLRDIQSGRASNPQIASIRFFTDLDMNGGMLGKLKAAIGLGRRDYPPKLACITKI